MIRHLVDFALRQRTVILICALILTGLGINSFYNVPIEAYPDVADTWVQVITQWPGHAAEEVERQITVPTEREMNGVPKQTALTNANANAGGGGGDAPGAGGAAAGDGRACGLRCPRTTLEARCTTQV